jgi:phosphoribosylaminoimidazole-succinocarboxamide synthase
MAMTQSNLPLERVNQGKVRDVYAVNADRLLLVATDRISAFDVVMDEAVPFKGRVLTQMSAWWCRRLGGMDHHMISVDTDEIISAVPALAPHRVSIDGRATLCRRTTVFPIECVVRGYLSGSAWKEYSRHGTLAGEPLAKGFLESQELTPPLFSPATKAQTGHDENITIAGMKEIVGEGAATELERLSRTIYERGRDIARERGIIIADAKFEFGRDATGGIILIDEALTPDSSRFWPLCGYRPGRPQPSYDKQPLRDFLDGERRAGRWNGDAPAPRLSAEIVEATSQRYRDAFLRLTGADVLAT